ncbi:hypothetical protein GCM10020295_60740 [Streptomyces cinereospinus]
MPLDEHVAHAETAQEEGEGQAHQRAAHDEDGNLVIGFLLHQGLLRQWWGGGEVSEFFMPSLRGSA